MPLPNHQFESRRQFLKFLSGSPLLACGGLAAYGAEPLTPAERVILAQAQTHASMQATIASPADAINVFDFEPVFRRTVPPAHVGYMASGIDSEVTLRANREAFSKIAL